MSAIAGIHNFTGERVSPDAASRLMEGLAPCLADRTGTWTEGATFLGCRLLELTPEAEREELPRFSGLRGLAITADAVLDNRQELLDRFGIDSAVRDEVPDSELILLAYEKWGEASPAWLAGDFAYVIWDEKRRRLFGARDHSGKRTLYYHGNGERFAFATLLRPLLALPGVEKRLNEEWLAEYLAITGMIETADGSLTAYRDIFQVPPAHAFVCSDARIRLTEYVRLEPGETLRLGSDAEYEEAFREVVAGAVRPRLRSRRPVGAQLSGGLDSGTVASFAALGLREQGRQLETFSFVPVDDFTDWTPRHLMANEKTYMEATASLHPNMRTHFHDFAGSNPLSVMDSWLELMETPYKFFENSYWLKGLFEEAGKRGIGVLYSGARGNYTISWGPALDYYSRILRKLQLVRFVRELGAYSRNMGVSRSRVLSVVGQRAFPILQGFARPVASAPSAAEFPQWIHPEFAARTGAFERIAARGFAAAGHSTLAASDAIEARIKHFQCNSLWNASGASFTKLSLRYGVHSCDPTNDLRVIRFCLSLPLDQFVRDGAGRSLVRRSTRGILADPVRLNQRTRGVQAADWVHRTAPVWKECSAEMEAMCADPAMREYVNTEALRRGLDRFRDAPAEKDTFDPELRLLMRSLIVYRFLRQIL